MQISLRKQIARVERQVASRTGESQEVFIYDIPVRQSHQRKGVGRQLMDHLRVLAHDAGITVLFVPPTTKISTRSS